MHNSALMKNGFHYLETVNLMFCILLVSWRFFWIQSDSKNIQDLCQLLIFFWSKPNVKLITVDSVLSEIQIRGHMRGFISDTVTK